MTEHDVLIVGAGPVGAFAALALNSIGVDCALIDARAPDASSRDARVLALSYASRQLIESVGVWERLDPTPIDTIHISQRGHFGRTLLRAVDFDIPALGYVQDAAGLAAALHTKLVDAAIPCHWMTEVERVMPRSSHVEVFTSAMTRSFSGKLVILAEGSVSDDERVKRRAYRQEAIVAIVRPAGAHRGVAYERFTPGGPVALLPKGDDYAAILSVGTTEAASIATLPDAAFLERLRRELGERLDFVETGPRARFPLSLAYRDKTVDVRRVALGNAAQTLHPVAGQGFNLGLRDVWTLREILAVSPGVDPGAGSVLARYEAERWLDRNAVIRFTDGLVRLFANDFFPLAAARGAGLLTLDVVPQLREFLARRMIFGARAW